MEIEEHPTALSPGQAHRKGGKDGRLDDDDGAGMETPHGSEGGPGAATPADQSLGEGQSWTGPRHEQDLGIQPMAEILGAGVAVDPSDDQGPRLLHVVPDPTSTMKAAGSPEDQTKGCH